ncbi:MAG: DUF3383 domain-containing protein [Rhizobiaceae bacterium]|nr:DUF3383 domain-containing protein [Rhizobiaceae bacterium]
MIVTDETTGPVNDNVRTKVYSTMEEVAADWDASDEAYKVAATMFAQNPRPLQIKIGFRENETGSDISDELDAIVAFDNNWYQLVFTNSIRGVDTDEDAAIVWTESKNKILFLGTTDVLLKTLSDTTNVAARNKLEYDRTAVFFNAAAGDYLEAAVAAFTATRNFDRPASAYTSKFKRMRGVDLLNEASGPVQIITGFVPALGLDATAGHLANVFVNIGGAPVLVEGNVLSKAFIDEIHASDWLIARTQEELLGILNTNDRVPMTDPGVQILASGVEAVMNRAVTAGLIAEDFDDEGNLVPAYEITPTRVRSISAAQRRNRIAPPISGVFRYAGACHYASVAFTMTF